MDGRCDRRYDCRRAIAGARKWTAHRILPFVTPAGLDRPLALARSLAPSTQVLDSRFFASMDEEGEGEGGGKKSRERQTNSAHMAPDGHPRVRLSLGPSSPA